MGFWSGFWRNICNNNEAKGNASSGIPKGYIKIVIEHEGISQLCDRDESQDEQQPKVKSFFVFRSSDRLVGVEPGPSFLLEFSSQEKLRTSRIRHLNLWVEQEKSPKKIHW